jgi:Protein of unknown function (DUF3224)
MTKTLKTRLEIKSWDEKPYRELPDGSKFTKADVVLAGKADEAGTESGGEGGTDGLESATFDALLFYRADGTSSYVTLMHVTGTLDGRSGSFVLQGSGTYDGRQAIGESFVVPGSGTGDLAGLSGKAESVSTHDDYPFMPLTLGYEFE